MARLRDIFSRSNPFTLVELGTSLRAHVHVTGCFCFDCIMVCHQHNFSVSVRPFSEFSWPFLADNRELIACWWLCRGCGNMLSAQSSASRARKSRPSASFCREKFACARAKALASYECEECGTEQCADCERQLHEDRKYAAHSRRRVRPVTPDRLCDSRQPCEPRNFADVVCAECGNVRYCFDCDRRVHRAQTTATQSRSGTAASAKLSAHRREPFVFPSRRTFPGSAVAGEPFQLLSQVGQTAVSLNPEEICYKLIFWDFGTNMKYRGL